MKNFLLIFVLGMMLMACDQPITPAQKCAALLAAQDLSCDNPDSEACKVARAADVAGGCVTPTPQPSPTPTPVATPTPTPTVHPTPTPVPTPVPTPTPDPWAVCPKRPDDGASVIVNTSVYGQGVDTSVYVLGDTEFCQIIHGVGTNKCHLEGWKSRQQCETQLVEAYSGGKGKCPVFRYRTKSHEEPCVQVDPYDKDGMSCDHFGNTVQRDDPLTKPFEGVPTYCGLQRDADGYPMAGYFTIAHGDGEVQACLPGFTGCGRWTRVVH